MRPKRLLAIARRLCVGTVCNTLETRPFPETPHQILESYRPAQKISLLRRKSLVNRMPTKVNVTVRLYIICTSIRNPKIFFRSVKRRFFAFRFANSGGISVSQFPISNPDLYIDCTFNDYSKTLNYSTSENHGNI